MKEKTLFKIALICSLVGIIALYFISEKISINEVSIDKINEIDVGKSVKITGRVEKVSDSGKVMFLEVGQEKIETIPVLLFKDSAVSLKKGDYVEITGTVENYEGEREVIANRVRII